MMGRDCKHHNKIIIVLWEICVIRNLFSLEKSLISIWWIISGVKSKALQKTCTCSKFAILDMFWCKSAQMVKLSAVQIVTIRPPADVKLYNRFIYAFHTIEGGRNVVGVALNLIRWWQMVDCKFNGIASAFHTLLTSKRATNFAFEQPEAAATVFVLPILLLRAPSSSHIDWTRWLA